MSRNDYDEEDEEQNTEVDEAEEELVTGDAVETGTIMTDSKPMDKHPIEAQEKLAKDLKNRLKIAITDESSDVGPSPYKVAVIGMNELGSATAFLLICRQVVTDVILIDRNAKRLAAEHADLSTCSSFVSGVHVHASNELASCEGARIVILCDILDDEQEKDKEQSPSNTNRLFFRVQTISKAISLYAPECVMIVAIQPFEIMAQLCASQSILPSHRILAPGTMIDAAHFRLLIGEKLDISPASITGLIVGAHGENNYPLWNSITVGGIHLLSENPLLGTLKDKENWRQLHTKVNQRQAEIKKTKGTEIWSISMASTELVECILRNKREIHPVTVNVKGYHGISTDLFLSIPAVIGHQGVSHLITTKLNDSASETSFSTIVENIRNVNDERLSQVDMKQ